MNFRYWQGLIACGAALALSLDCPNVSAQPFVSEGFSYYFEVDKNSGKAYRTKVNLDSWPGQGVGNIINQSNNAIWWKNEEIAKQLALWRNLFGAENSLDNDVKFFYSGSSNGVSRFTSSSDDEWEGVSCKNSRQNNFPQCNSIDAVVGRHGELGAEPREEISVIGPSSAVRDDTTVKGEAVSNDLGTTLRIFAGGDLRVTANNRVLTKDYFVGNFKDNTRNGINNNSFAVEFSGSLIGPGEMNFKGSGVTVLSGDNKYIGRTNVVEGTLRVGKDVGAGVLKGSLDDKTRVSVSAGALYDVVKADTVGSIEGAGQIQVANGQVLTAGGAMEDGEVLEYSGVMSGAGGFTKVGKGIQVFSGSNMHTGTTRVEDGILRLGNGLALKTSPSVVDALGRLDLISLEPSQGKFEIDTLTVNGGGRVLVRGAYPLHVQTATLNAVSETGANSGGFIVGFSDRNLPPIVVDPGGAGFTYQSGTLFAIAPQDVAPEGVWKIISGTVNNTADLAKNTFLRIVSRGGKTVDYSFKGLGYENRVNGQLMVNYYGYLQQGSLELFIAKQPIAPDVIPPDPSECEDPALCNLIIDPPVVIFPEVIDEIVNPPFIEGDLDLPILSWEDVGKLVFSGLLPRNVNAPGRALSAFNNLLSDAVFERLPLRQFRSVDIGSAVETDASIGDHVEVQNDRHGSVVQRNASHDIAVANVFGQPVGLLRDLSGDGSEKLAIDHHVQAFKASEHEENHSLAAQYSKRDNVRAWFRAFGGSAGAARSDIFYNDYNINVQGGVLGADFSLAPQLQLGIFANYGDLNLIQYDSGTGGGSWVPSGWGGGVTMDYWTDHFYVQGLLAATGFEGTQRRGIVEITDDLGGVTATGGKYSKSYAYAMRMGAPMVAGSLVVEPQVTAVWSLNDEYAFSESGAGKLNLRYENRATSYLNTALGVKVSRSISQGERELWAPSFKLAWLADWDLGNEDQVIGYTMTKNTIGVPSYEKDVNGLLVELGLDYSIANLNSLSWKFYVKGGAEFWDGDRGTDWRASGGVTVQF